MKRFLVTLLVAVVGGLLFTLIHSPLPWLLGPMVFAFIGARVLTRMKPLWPGYLRNTALIIIGYSLGLSFTRETLSEMGLMLPSMLMMTVLLILFSGAIGLLVAKISRQPLPTVILGSIPGGLSQMIILAEDTKGIDLTIVTFLQVSRLMMIIFIVPQLVFSPLFGGSRTAIDAALPSAGAHWGDLSPNIIIFGVVCVAAALLAQKIRFPSAFLLGPMIVTAVLHLSGVSGPALPSSMLDLAQLLIGTYVGLLLKPESLTHKFRIITLSICSGVVLIAGSLGLSVLLTHLHSFSPATSFLSMAPGGMDQMGIMGKEVNADIAIISCYQIFRTWFIFFAIPPLLKLVFRRLIPKTPKEGLAGANN